jgi:hypothetical protein
MHWVCSPHLITVDAHVWKHRGWINDLNAEVSHEGEILEVSP